MRAGRLSKKTRKRQDDSSPVIPIWLIGAVAGVLLGILTVWLEYKNEKSIAVGLTIALLSALIGLAIESREVLEKRNVLESRYGRLMKSLEDCSLPEDNIIDVLDAAGRIDVHDKFIKEHALAALHICKAELINAAILVIQKTTYDVRSLIALVQGSQNHVYAISTEADLNFWDDVDGKKYLKVQEEAMKDRKVSVLRLFVFERSTLDNRKIRDSLKRIMGNQEEMGMDVKWIDDVAFYNHRKALEDYKDLVIVDEYSVIETETTPTGKAGGMLISFDKKYVEERCDFFLRYWELGQSPTELPSLPL